MTALLVDSAVKYFLILPMFQRLQFADLTAFDTCAAIFMLGSKTEPRLAIGILIILIISPSTEMLGTDILARC